MSASATSIVLGAVATLALAALVLVLVCERVHRADWGGRWLNRLDGLNRLFCRTFHHFVADPVPLPAQGGALLASNHVSGLDALLLIAACERPLRFVMAQEEYDRWWLRWLFKRMLIIPVERDTRSARAVFAARRALKAGEVVVIFPHGGMHLDTDPPQPLKPGIAFLAGATGVPICPVRLEGIRGAGLTVRAVFVSSRARLQAFPPFTCPPAKGKRCLKELERLLSPPAPK